VNIIPEWYLSVNYFNQEFVLTYANHVNKRHWKKAFVILTIAFVTRVATVDQNSPLWQPAMGSKTYMEYRKSRSCYKGWEVC